MKMMVKAETSGKIVKCALVGDGLVGKTSLVRRFAHMKSTDHYVATVFDNFAGHVAVDGQKYTVSIYDTAGQQDYEGLRVFTYAHSDVILVCFSVVDRESYNNVLEFWVPEIRSFVGKDKPIVLVATQTDLGIQVDSDTDGIVTRAEGLNLANKIGARMFVESSAQDPESVTKLFEGVVSQVSKPKRRKTSILDKIMGR